MLHVRMGDRLAADASEKLVRVGLTVSATLRILLSRIVKKADCRPGSPPIQKLMTLGSAPRCRRPLPVRGPPCPIDR